MIRVDDHEAFKRAEALSHGDLRKCQPEWQRHLVKLARKFRNDPGRKHGGTHITGEIFRAIGAASIIRLDWWPLPGSDRTPEKLAAAYAASGLDSAQLARENSLAILQQLKVCLTKLLVLQTRASYHKTKGVNLIDPATDHALGVLLGGIMEAINIKTQPQLELSL